MEKEHKSPVLKLGFWLVVALLFFVIFKQQQIFFRIIASVIASFLIVYVIRLGRNIIEKVF
jgi:hypothetical protein